MGGRLLDWLGSGLASAKPDPATMVSSGKIVSGSAALYFATDTKNLSVWDEGGTPDPVWFDIDVSSLSSIAFLTLPDVNATGLADGQVFKYDVASTKMVPLTLQFQDAESIHDVVAALTAEGSGISIVYDDVANTLTFSSTVTQYTDEMAQDTIAALIAAGTHVGINVVYDDAANTLSFTNTITQYTDADADARVNALAPGIADARIAAASVNALADVDTATTPPADQQALIWDATTSLWIPGDVAGGGGNAPWYLATAPLVADYALVSGDATNLTVSDDADVGFLFDAGAPVTGDKHRLAERVIANPNANWTWTVRMESFNVFTNYSGVVITCRDSVGGKLLNFGYDQTRGIAFNRISSLAGPYSAAIVNIAEPSSNVVSWFRLAFDNATGIITASVSPNGKIWSVLGAENYTTFLINKPTRVGFGATQNRATGPRIVGSVGFAQLS